MIPFTIIVELGVVGLFLFFKIIQKSYSSINSLTMLNEYKKTILRLVLGSMVIGSLINASYFFITGIILVIYYQEVEER